MIPDRLKTLGPQSEDACFFLSESSGWIFFFLLYNLKGLSRQIFKSFLLSTILNQYADGLEFFLLKGLY